LFEKWRSYAECHPRQAIKVPPFPPLRFAYKKLQRKKIFFVIIKGKKYKKHLEHDKQTLTN